MISESNATIRRLREEITDLKDERDRLTELLADNASLLRDIADGIDDDDPRVRLKVIISALEYAADKHGGKP